jgi:uncharacterized protein (DUF58 family)
MKGSPASGSVEPEVTPKLGFQKNLYGLYFRSSEFHHFVSQRLRPAGVALGLVLLLATCLAIGHDRNSIYQLFSLSLGMVLIGIPWAMLRRANLEAKRELPRFATAGQPLRYQIRVWNHGRKRLSRAWLADTPPDPRPKLEDYLTLREPGEEERNAFDRRLAYFRWQWLMLENRCFTGGVSRQDILVPPDQSINVAMEILPLRRGVIQLQDLRLLLPDPFGLFQRCRKIKAPSATITVLPKRYRLPPIELPGGAAFRISGEANTHGIGTTGEFMGLRDYRPGDPLRQIHWKSWARTGRPIVKELEDTYFPRYGLVVDTFSCDPTDHVFEEAISVAASFAAAIDTNQSLLDLMFIKNQAHMVTAGRGVDRAEKLLEVLAGVTPERTSRYEELAKLVLRHRDDLSSCVVIFNGWDGERADFLKRLMQGGVICVPLIIGKGPAPSDIPGHWLQYENIARDLQRLPRHLQSC